MADATIGVTQSVTPDRLLDSESLTVSAQTVYRERNRIAGLGATELADVKGAAPASGDMGLAVRQVGIAAAAAPSDNATNNPVVSLSSLLMMFNGTTWDRLRGTITNGVLVDVARVTGNVAITAAALPLPSGAATSANQTTVGSATTKINDGTNTAAVKAASTAAVAADQALVVAISPNTPVNVVAASSVTANAISVQTVGTTSGSILSANARKKYMISNIGLTIIYLGFGQTPTAAGGHIALSACSNFANDGTGGVFVGETWDGAVNAISNAAGGKVVVTEMT